MIEIKFYGTNTSTYQFINKILMEFIEFHQLDVKVIQISDVASFIRDQIISVPTIILDEENKYEFKDSENFQKSIKEVLHKILELSVNKSRVKKIMVATDFSDTSIAALYFAKSFFKSTYYLLDIVNVFRINPVDVIHQPDMVSKLEEDSKYNLSQIASELEAEFIGDFSNNVIVNSRSIEGIASIEILKASTQYDYIVLGTHGATDILQRLLGSVSETVASKAHCPVFLVPSDVQFYKPNNLIILQSENIDTNNKISYTFPKCHKIYMGDDDVEMLQNFLEREDVFFLMNRHDFIKIFGLIPNSKFKKYYELLLQYKKPLVIWAD